MQLNGAPEYNSFVAGAGVTSTVNPLNAAASHGELSVPVSAGSRLKQVPFRIRLESTSKGGMKVILFLNYFILFVAVVLTATTKLDLDKVPYGYCGQSNQPRNQQLS